MKKIILALMTMATASIQTFASPVDCYMDSRIKTMNVSDAIRLCKGSAGLAAVDCYLDSRIKTMAVNESIRLCAGATYDWSPVDCYLDQRIKSLSIENSITLCGNH